MGEFALKRELYKKLEHFFGTYQRTLSRRELFYLLNRSKNDFLTEDEIL